MYRLLIEYQLGAKSIAQKIAEALQSMAKQELSLGNIETEFKPLPNLEYGFSITVQTDDLSRTSLLFRDKAADVVQSVTFVRPCTIANDYITASVK